MPSSPTFPMSSCLTGSGVRSYRMELEIVVKSSSPSVCTSNSSPSSTLSESSNSTPLFISTKRARTPRKRPNQCSDEAAALLSSIYPNLFSATNPRQQSFQRRQPHEDPFPVLLPSFQISGDSGLLLHDLPSPTKSPIELKLAKADDARIRSPQDFQFQCPGSPDFDAESILDEEVEEGIDSIMGNLSVSRDADGDFPNSKSNSILTPYLASLLRFGFGGGFRSDFGISSNMSRALRRSNDGEWWRSPTVSVNDIVPKFDEPPITNLATAPDKKKRKKKKKLERDELAVEKEIDTPISSPEDVILKPQLGLKLNYDSILNEWTGPPPFSDENGLPESAANVAAMIADIELFPDATGGGMREASVQRYKEKRRNRLFSKKIRYEVRKTNADQRPRMKASGRFVRGPTLCPDLMAEE